MKHAKWWLVAGVAGVWWWRSRGTEQATQVGTVQAAVLANGFAAVVAPGAVTRPRRIIELDRSGKPTHEMPLRLDHEVRLVGTRVGTAVGWKDGRKVKLATLDSDGKPDEVSSWGKRARQLCDGVATNEHRFGIGWLESDSSVWFVGGPVRPRLAELETSGVEATAKVSWCGVASADHEVVLLWRESKKLWMNFCDKQCSPQSAKVPIDPDHQLLAFGCARSTCVFASRDQAGAVKLVRVNENGRAIARPLDAAAETMAIVGAGSSALAIAYASKGTATIQRVTADELTVTHTWHFENSTTAPSLAWAGDRLLIAQPDAFHVLDVPR